MWQCKIIGLNINDLSRNPNCVGQTFFKLLIEMPAVRKMEFCYYTYTFIFFFDFRVFEFYKVKPNTV